METHVIKKGSKEPAHFLDMSYYSGVHNGFQFFRYIYFHNMTSYFYFFWYFFCIYCVFSLFFLYIFFFFFFFFF